jgi:hypothetical protein
MQTKTDSETQPAVLRKLNWDNGLNKGDMSLLRERDGVEHTIRRLTSVRGVDNRILVEPVSIKA